MYVDLSTHQWIHGNRNKHLLPTWSSSVPNCVFGDNSDEEVNTTYRHRSCTSLTGSNQRELHMEKQNLMKHLELKGSKWNRRAAKVPLSWSMFTVVFFMTVYSVGHANRQMWSLSCGVISPLLIQHFYYHSLIFWNSSLSGLTGVITPKFWA